MNAGGVIGYAHAGGPSALSARVVDCDGNVSESAMPKPRRMAVELPTDLPTVTALTIFRCMRLLPRRGLLVVAMWARRECVDHSTGRSCKSNISLLGRALLFQVRLGLSWRKSLAHQNC